jgi:hypothetical protein
MRKRKLHLNRETLRNLANDHLHGIAGGFTTRPDCDPSQILNCTDPSAVCGTGRSNCLVCDSDGCAETQLC